MAITLQRKLELAGALSKVQPELRRLHLLRKPKKRNRLRTVVLVGSVVAVGTAVAAVVLRRRGGRSDAVTRHSGQTDDFLTQDTASAKPGSEEPAIDADDPQFN